MIQKLLTVSALMIILSFTSLAHTEVKDPIYDDLEGLPLVEALIRDQKLKEAEAELKSLPPSDKFWHLSGDLEMGKQSFKKAVANYIKANSSTDRELKIARAYFQLKDYKKCESLYQNTKTLWLENESDIINKATCEYMNRSADKAWQSLLKGQKKFSSYAIQREQVAFSIELQLSQEALKLALTDAKRLSASQLLALAELFHIKKFSNEALTILEYTRIRFPFDVDVNLSFAQLYFQKGQLLSTVEAFERAAKTDPKFTYHVAELRRQLGQREQALYANQMIPDTKERLKSKMALYVDAGDYPMIASLESVLSRSELKDDDEMRYALAYSLVRQGDLDRTLTHLNRIQKPELLEKTAMLKKAVLECRNSTGSCRL